MQIVLNPDTALYYQDTGLSTPINDVTHEKSLISFSHLMLDAIGGFLYISTDALDEATKATHRVASTEADSHEDSEHGDHHPLEGDRSGIIELALLVATHPSSLSLTDVRA